MEQSLAILGAGRFGETLLEALLRSSVLRPERVHCTVRRPERAVELAERYGVRADTDSRAAAAEADVIVLAVKPQTVRTLLEQIAGTVQPRQTVISLIAGVPTLALEDALGSVPVVRAMSNTAMQVGEAMTAIAPGRHATAAHLTVTEALMSPVGRVLRLDERQLDAVTALSGSGPAYFFYLVEAMTEAGVLLGLPRDVASELIVQTMLGSARMLRDSGRHPVELREAVTSPAGTTAAALRVLEEQGVRAAFLNAAEAAARRSRELAGG